MNVNLADYLIQNFFQENHDIFTFCSFVKYLTKNHGFFKIKFVHFQVNNDYEKSEAPFQPNDHQLMSKTNLF